MPDGPDFLSSFASSYYRVIVATSCISVQLVVRCPRKYTHLKPALYPFSCVDGAKRRPQMIQRSVPTPSPHAIPRARPSTP